MKKLLIVIVILVNIVGFSAYAQEGSTPEALESELDLILNGFLAEGQAPGAALLVITPNWTYEKAVGVTERGGTEPVTPDMHFQIGSNTKMMTATMILQLHEEGALDVDDPLSKYLPDVASRVANGDKITIRQMLKHRSGLWDYVDGDAPVENNGLFWLALDDEELFSKTFTYDELIDFMVENQVPVFEPDSVGEDGLPNYDYSNTGYLFLGMIVEEVTGQTFEEAVTERIFEPLGMEDTLYVAGIVPEGLTPRGYAEDRDTTDMNLSAAGPAGAVVSTPRDMATFITALVNGELYEDPATLDLMLSDPTPTSGGLFNYALGIQDKGPLVGETNLWGHGGQTLAFISDVAYDMETETAIVAWASYYETTAGYAAPLVMQAINTVTESGE